MININKILNCETFDAVEKIELIKSIMAVKGDTEPPKDLNPIKRMKKPNEYSMTPIAIKRRDEYAKKRLDPTFLQKRTELNKNNYAKRKKKVTPSP